MIIQINQSLLYPLRIVNPNTNEVNQEEKVLIRKILELMKNNKKQSFFMKDLISLDEFNIKKAEIALSLCKREIIQTILF